MAMYFYDSEKLPVGAPIYGFAYNYTDDLSVIRNYKPTLGIIEEPARYSRNGKFIPNDKTLPSVPCVILNYATTQREAMEMYDFAVKCHISYLKEKIAEIQEKLALAENELNNR